MVSSCIKIIKKVKARAKEVESFIVMVIVAIGQHLTGIMPQEKLVIPKSETRFIEKAMVV
ncbi:hypothetical protein AGMMS49950_09860 [Endomicrobiia bacterium]|nr:hypothetical protein AGMMS49950_09860 [Endomicrobiia bacterium]